MSQPEVLKYAEGKCCSGFPNCSHAPRRPIDGGGLDFQFIRDTLYRYLREKRGEKHEAADHISYDFAELCSTFGNRGLVAIDVNKINYAIWQVDEAMPLDLRMKIAEHICSKFGTPPTKVEWPEKKEYPDHEPVCICEMCRRVTQINAMRQRCIAAHEKSLGKEQG